MKQMLEVLKEVHSDQELRKEIIPLFLGNPGLGKTRILEKFVKEELKVNMVTFVASQRLPNEISGMAMPDVEKELMKFFDYDTLLDLKDGDVLFLDEILNANPMVLNAMLTLLEDRVTISGKKLANIMIVAAANKQGATILTPQQKQRFVWYEVKFDPVMWGRFMYKKFNMIDNIIEQLCTMIGNETFNTSTYNYFSPRSIVRAVDMMIKGVPTPYEKDLKGILAMPIENNSSNPILIGEYSWLPSEKISWLKLKQLELKTKKDDKTNSK